MEQKIKMVAKKMLKIVRVALFMLRKGMSKRKLLMDLNMLKHRTKIAGKSLFGHITFHHHHATNSHGGDHLHYPTDGSEFEFSCSSTPVYRHFLPTKKNNHRHHAPTDLQDISFEAVCKVLEKVEMMASNDEVGASPALPGFGFGRSPMPVRQLRITDSPYPVQNPDPQDNRVDKQAEEFIKKFYSQLNNQNF